METITTTPAAAIRSALCSALTDYRSLGGHATSHTSGSVYYSDRANAASDALADLDTIERDLTAARAAMSPDQERIAAGESVLRDLARCKCWGTVCDMFPAGDDRCCLPCRARAVRGEAVTL